MQPKRARGNRLLEEQPGECAEHALMLLPVAFQHIIAGDFATARDISARAAGVARRFRDAEALALALNIHGRSLIYQGEVADGLASLDEAMLAVVGGELSPAAAGNVYCSVIEACQEISELRRAQEWTAALSTWCERQHGLVTFTGRCLVHRAEFMRLRGAWAEASKEAARAFDRLAGTSERYMAGSAIYQQAEVYRLGGEFGAADEAYQRAGAAGCEPQPGWALLRLAQGRNDSAKVLIGRALAETSSRHGRARLLPAYVEIMLAVGDVRTARAGADELIELTALFQTPGLRAAADHVDGAVLLAEGDANGAVGALLRAWHSWRDLDAPYEAACARMRIGLARRALGDHESAVMDLNAARQELARLGANADVSHLDSLLARKPESSSHGLTTREREVLRLLATGKTNMAIAAELHVASKTVDRHVSNIFAKLGVSSRAAATAYAYQHRLV